MPAETVSTVIVFFSCLFLVARAQISEDQSLKDACEAMSSLYTQRSSPTAAEGDRCDMQWNVHTSDEQQAREFCELYAPWRLNKVQFGAQTICYVEATVMCQAGWIQMFGHCVRSPENYKRMKHADALAACTQAHPQAKIAHLRHKYIVGVWRRMFPQLEQIWVQASEGWEPYMQKVDNQSAVNELALAFVGDEYTFNVMSNSLIYVHPNSELQVLCEYKPPVTRAEINYLSRKYQEITHKAVQVDDGVLIRTQSFYGSYEPLDRTKQTSNVEVCQKVLKPYMNNDEIGQFVPTADKLQSLATEKPDSLTFSLSHAIIAFNFDHMRSMVICRRMNPGALQYRVRVGANMVFFPSPEPFEKCDNMGCTAVSFANATSPAALVPISDSLQAPIWCQLGVKKQYIYVIPDGWTRYDRSNGEVVAHKIMNDTHDFKGAGAACKNEGALLGGFHDKTEALFMIEMLKTAGIVSAANEDNDVWLGLRRRVDCYGHWAINPPVTNRCHKWNVMKWEDNVASGSVDSSLWGQAKDGTQNPDYGGRLQDCGTIFAGVPGWALATNPGSLDDNGCTTKRKYFCTQKMQSIVQV